MLRARFLYLLFPLALLLGGKTTAEPADLTELSIEQLMQIPVTSVARKPQQLATAAAAVYVVSSDEIKRSGATSLPELLSMVPGVEVASINAHQSSVAIRGFSGQWSTKLLVLLDSRSVYTQTFSGVYWDALGVMLEDIERIEVIRGPGAALWGANAVNGVINIITKSAATTDSGLVSVGADNQRSAFLNVRQGGRLGEFGYARGYVRGERRGATRLAQGGDGEDAWDNSRVGARADWDLPSGDRLMVQADAYRLSYSNPPFDPGSVVAAIGTLAAERGSASGHALGVRWNRAHSLTAESILHAYLEASRRDDFIPIDERSYNIELQNRFEPLRGHDVVWGGHLRYRKDDFGRTDSLLIAPSGSDDLLYSLFVQDEMAWQEGRLKLTLGSKFEHTDSAGWEIQPSAKLLWAPSASHTWWASIARAARTPSRVERGLWTTRTAMLTLPGLGALPLVTRFLGDPAFAVEKITSYEVGYRALPSSSLSIDIALFYNDYRDLRGVNYTLDLRGWPLTMDARLGNTVAGGAFGGEVAFAWSPAERWRLQGFAGHLDMRLDDSTDARYDRFYSGSSPRWQAGLRSSWDLNPRWMLNLGAKYVGKLSHPYNETLLADGEVPAYVNLDIGITWVPTADLEISLIGKRLLDGGGRIEYSTESGAPISELSRTVLGKLSWRF